MGNIASANDLDAINDGDVERRIREKAYEIYESRNREDGTDVDDWFAAEKQVRGGDSGDVSERRDD